MKVLIFGAAIALSLSASLASAKMVKCDLQTFSGGSEDVVSSWTGYNFVVDTKKNRVKMIGRWFSVTDRVTKKFTTYTTRGNDASMMYDSDNLKIDLAYRIYNTNKCQVRINFGKNYRPMQAKGRVK